MIFSDAFFLKKARCELEQALVSSPKDNIPT